MEEAVYQQMKAAEEKEGTCFSVAVAHHTFLNPLVLRSVLRRREAEGKPRCALVCFVHGTGESETKVQIVFLILRSLITNTPPLAHSTQNVRS